MDRSKEKHKQSVDHIQGEKIILYDRDLHPGPKTLKIVEIITPSGSRRVYTIRRTTRGGYLFN